MNSTNTMCAGSDVASTQLMMQSKVFWCLADLCLSAPAHVWGPCTGPHVPLEPGVLQQICQRCPALRVSHKRCLDEHGCSL